METVLVTGAAGKVGRAVMQHLQAVGHGVRPFDLALGHDLRRDSDVAEAMAGCEMVVHAGALAHDWAGTPADIMATSLLGTWHVLLATEQHRVRRVVYFSSVQACGLTDGENEPCYLPVDDAHPLRAARPYGLSKRLAEEMCQAWTARTGIPTVVFRPVLILNDGDPRLSDRGRAEFDAYVHLDDVAAAVALALAVDIAPHVRLTLCGPGQFDTTTARKVLGWAPQHGWP